VGTVRIWPGRAASDVCTLALPDAGCCSTLCHSLQGACQISESISFGLAWINARGPPKLLYHSPLQLDRGEEI